MKWSGGVWKGSEGWWVEERTDWDGMRNETGENEMGIEGGCGNGMRKLGGEDVEMTTAANGDNGELVMNG